MTNVAIIFPEPLVEGTVSHIKEDEQGHFRNTINRAVALCYGADVESATIHLREREQRRIVNDVVYNEGGWLEHIIVIKYVGGRQMSVGAIQRKPGNDSEFHS